MAEIRTWRDMIDSNAALLKRKTGEDAPTWAARAREADVGSPEGLQTWLGEHQVTGYSALAVKWEFFGYPEFMLQDSSELIDGQYADRKNLRPIVDALLEWAAGTPAVVIQARRTYVSLQTGRRKFAQITPSTKSAVDVLLRLESKDSQPGRIEAVKPPAGSPFDRRIRLRSLNDVDPEVLDTLELARQQNL